METFEFILQLFLYIDKFWTCEIIPMNSNYLKDEYQIPEVEILNVSAFAVICGSPKPGENEDVDYEDW